MGRKIKEKKYDTAMTIRFNSEELKEFKKVVGEKMYQKKIRELMNSYVAKTKEIDEMELKKRQEYLQKKIYF